MNFRCYLIDFLREPLWTNDGGHGCHCNGICAGRTGILGACTSLDEGVGESSLGPKATDQHGSTKFYNPLPQILAKNPPETMVDVKDEIICDWNHRMGVQLINEWSFLIRAEVLVKMPPGSELPELVHLATQFGRATDEISLGSRESRPKDQVHVGPHFNLTRPVLLAGPRYQQIYHQVGTLIRLPGWIDWHPWWSRAFQGLKRKVIPLIGWFTISQMRTIFPTILQLCRFSQPHCLSKDQFFIHTPGKQWKNSPATIVWTSLPLQFTRLNNYISLAKVWQLSTFAFNHLRDAIPNWSQLCTQLVC